MPDERTRRARESKRSHAPRGAVARDGRDGAVARIDAPYAMVCAVGDVEGTCRAADDTPTTVVCAVFKFTTVKRVVKLTTVNES
jgi:hypothetical protein